MKSLNPGYRALIFGASGGIGGAILACLESDPYCVAAIPVSRRGEHGVDITDEEMISVAAVQLARQFGHFDLIFNATGALTIDTFGPEKSIRAIDPSAMARQFAVNAIGPALLLKHFSPLLPKDRHSIFASLSARVGSIGDNRLGGWVSYRASKAAQNQVVKTAAIELGRSHPLAVVVALHPGSVQTPLSEPFAKGHDRMTPEQSASLMLRTLDNLSPTESGGFFAYDGSRIEW
ncbi:SDR family oxidoreductase (plasmid) [Rhizobium sp. TH2]|uniref:SDR family oxidoreductase n=1 Tax=Rhizobium sp. TH2 TaxID=2775403 RepID=UPI00215894D6|nr:SDR family NAD(P)-dependent oxidoreductase [Rhizobium sp. TH2]UVC12684.1 SDR family oxidoreductase [Rhizobium sp. TH2]